MTDASFMTWIKICGITNLEDAQAAVEAGADALGFVFAAQSPRRVDARIARDIVKHLPGNVEKVGVFVDPSNEAVRAVAGEARLTAVQIHSAVATSRIFEDLENVEDRFGVAKLITVIPGNVLAQSGLVLSGRAKQTIHAILVDSGSGGTGGTGKTFDWKNAQAMVQHIGLTLPVIIAGGLNSENVGEAIEIFRPYGVDVSSGVEARPGKKDPSKIRAFVQAVRKPRES